MEDKRFLHDWIEYLRRELKQVMYSDDLEKAHSFARAALEYVPPQKIEYEVCVKDIIHDSRISGCACSDCIG